MHTASMTLAINDVVDSVHTARRVSGLAGWFDSFFWWYLGPKLERASETAGVACDRMRLMTLEIGQSTKEEIIDPDFKFRATLQELKNETREFQAVALSLKSSWTTIGGSESKMAKNMKLSCALMSEVFEEATTLQWAIAEHDADFSTRHEGFGATTQDELTAVFAKLNARA